MFSSFLQVRRIDLHRKTRIMKWSESMKQFVRYLYEYHNGNRVRNIGFIKVEKQMSKCTIQIHGRGVDFGKEKKLEVSVFYVKGEKCIGLPQGVIDGGTPVINYILTFEVEDVGNQERFESIEGLLLQNGDGKKYAAVWDDIPIDVEHIVMSEEKGEEEVVEELPREPEEHACKETFKEQEIHTCEEACKEACEEEVEQYIPPRTRTYNKIQRQDISKLPRREWHLANNSFLLHGFYNYHHLLYIEEGEHGWLGVPGIYHEKERAVARAFGFPQFHRITDADVQLTNEEKNTYDDFGYWCRQVR